MMVSLVRALDIVTLRILIALNVGEISNAWWGKSEKIMMNQERFEQLGIEFGFEDEDELREQLKEYKTLCIEKAKRDNTQ